jgi:hypothetical protein
MGNVSVNPPFFFDSYREIRDSSYLIPQSRGLEKTGFPLKKSRKIAEIGNWENGSKLGEWE